MAAKKLVHIKISDVGWILERIARELTERLPYIGYGLEEDPSVAIQYYITYGCRKERVSPYEIAFFTHKENVTSAAEKFDYVANNVDYCIAQSLATEKILYDLSIKTVRTISPGVDLERFSPIVRIGVVGRTYHTGRKGEQLVQQVMDIPGIEWHFTGEGWPGIPHYIEEEKLPIFYRSLDYILIPAHIEGGPMCVIEALASGCKVIAAPVGWVPQFPHIEFKLGDVEDLRRVLKQVVDEKAFLRRSVETYTWDSFADKHNDFFKEILGYDSFFINSPVLSHKEDGENMKISKIKALVTVHGTEMSQSLGGPSVRAPKTAEALQKIGVEATFTANRSFNSQDYDVIHALNVWPPKTCEVLLRQIKKNDRPVVFSPIFLDLSEFSFYHNEIPQILAMAESEKDIIDALKSLNTRILNQRRIPFQSIDPFPGYYSSIQRLSRYADHLIFLSQHEQSLFQKLSIEHVSSSIVKNPVDASLYKDADASLFRKKIGINDYVLCVGRIETRKNQALLAFALRHTDMPLVLIGHEANEEYASLIKNWAGKNIIFAGRVEPGSAMLASAYAGAKVFCLPSWSEGAPLVALEAAAAGCNMVLSNRSSEQEYFGSLSRYVDPGNPEDIAQKIKEAWDEASVPSTDKSLKLQKKVETENSWLHYALQTKEAYKAAITNHSIKHLKSQNSSEKKRRIFIDLTTSAHHVGPVTGMARVEEQLAKEFHNINEHEVIYVFWNTHLRKFIKIDFLEVENRNIKNCKDKNINFFLKSPEIIFSGSDYNFSPNDIFLIFGASWLSNQQYLDDLFLLKKLYNVTMISTIYDLIPYKCEDWFPYNVGKKITLRFQQILNFIDAVLVSSKHTHADLSELLCNSNIPLPPMKVFRLGDTITDFLTDPIQENLISSLKKGEKYVLFVSTISIRKNHALLLMLWTALIKEYGDAVPTLVLVGRLGWQYDHLFRELDIHTELRKKILILHEVNDSTLDWLYRNCIFTVYPSFYEGWGLPVAESLAYGKICISSNRASLHEIAPENAIYIDPQDCVGWYKTIEKLCFSDEALSEATERANKFKITRWHETISQILPFITKISSTESFLQPIAVGETVIFSTAEEVRGIPSNSIIVEGWSHKESIGTWTDGAIASLKFQLLHNTSEALAICFHAQGFAPKKPVSVEIRINGQKVTNWQIRQSVSQYFAIIPIEFCVPGQRIQCEFLIDNPQSPKMHGYVDDRLLGVCMANMKIILATDISTETKMGKNLSLPGNLLMSFKNKIQMRVVKITSS